MVEEKIKQIYVALLLIFNAGIITRMIFSLLSSQENEDIDIGKIIKNLFKALIIGNFASSIVYFISAYFE